MGLVIKRKVELFLERVRSWVNREVDYIFLILLISCDSAVHPEIISVNSQEVNQQTDAEFTCILPVENHPKLLTPLDSLQTEFRKIADQNNYHGKMIVQFTINKTGIVEEPEIVSGGNETINKKALHFIKSAKFKPGTQRGKPVAVRYSLPLKLN